MFQRHHDADALAGADALARLDTLTTQATALSEASAGCLGWTGAERNGALRRMDRLAGVLATLRSALLLAEQQATEPAVGDRDFAATRARVTRTGLGEARREVRRAETLHALPAVTQAVRAGDVPLPHLDALARVSTGASEQAQSALARADVQDTLVRWAGRQSLKDFTASAARLVASFDPAALERTAEAQYRERFLYLSHQPEGTFVRGRLDRMAGEALSVALAAVSQAPDEERTRAQADADALLALAERATAGMAGVKARRTTTEGGLLPDAEQDAADARVTGVAARPTVSVLLPAETFAELRAHRARADRAPAGARRDAAEPEWRALEPAALEDGTPVPMSELARLLCDSEVGRIVIDAEGVPLDLGRTQRLYTGAQRRAVIVRDRVCAWNGCDVPAAYCDVHHIRWWDRDRGPTSVDNGVLLCSHHHRVVHRHDLAIVRLTRPPGRGAPMLGEPVRYEFRRDGRSINAPPGGVGTVAAAEVESVPGVQAPEQAELDVA